MKILDYLGPEKVNLNLKKGDKENIIRQIASLMVKTAVSGDPEQITFALLEREKTGSTGIGNGVAIPHAKTEGAEDIGVVYAYSDEGVDFDSVDGKPANFFFSVVSPSSEASVQLRLLARISRLMGNRLLRNELKKAGTPGEAIDAIRKHDEQ